MKMQKCLIAAMVAAVVGSLVMVDTAEAGRRDWKRVAELQAGGGAKEVTTDMEAAWILIKVPEGSVVINTVVLREGGKKTPITVGRRIEKGQEQILPIEPKRRLSGLRISDDGQGKYQVYLAR